MTAPPSLAARALVFLAAAAAAPGAFAERLDGPARVTLGPPTARYAMPGVDSQRSRRSSVLLSAAPTVKSRLRVAFGVGRGMIVREDGSFIVLHPSARMSSFDSQGKVQYSLKLAAEASSAPVVTSGGLVAFVAEGALAFVDELGRVRTRTVLSPDPNMSTRSILATRDGGVLVLGTAAIHKAGASGQLEWRQPTPEPLLELLEAGRHLVAVSDSGIVYGLDAAGRLRRLGDLGGPASSAALSQDGQSLLVRAGSRRLATFDLARRRLRSVAEDPTLSLDGPALLTSDGQALAFSTDGLLVRFRADGTEAHRVPVDPGARKAPSNDFALLLGDGRLLLARAAAELALVSGAGEVSTIDGSGCPDPVGVYPAGKNAVWVACRSGTVLRLE